MKRLTSFIMAVALIIICTSSVAEIMADPIFTTASISLSSSKTATFYARTKTIQESITVTSCKLYYYNGASWIYVCDLPVPSVQSTNASIYIASMDYSAGIASGNYRLYVTFSADGHTISRYSNSRTF